MCYCGNSSEEKVGAEEKTVKEGLGYYRCGTSESRVCFLFLIKGHKLISLLANMKSSYRIHEHNSDNYDNKLILTN